MAVFVAGLVVLLLSCFTVNGNSIISIKQHVEDAQVCNDDKECTVSTDHVHKIAAV